METCPLHPLIQAGIENIEKSQKENSASLKRIELVLLGDGSEAGWFERVRHLEEDVETIQKNHLHNLEEELKKVKDKVIFWRDKRAAFLLGLILLAIGVIIKIVLK